MGETLLEIGKKDKDILVLTSDSRSSSAITAFAKELPKQFIEAGIAEQNLVGIAAGIAATGKKPFITSPSCFLSARSLEQIKVDISYSKTNVKIFGVSGGFSYGALGMSHHSLQDIATIRSLPSIIVMMPADRHETRNMVKALAKYTGPAFVRIGRNAIPDIYESNDYGFEIGKAVELKSGSDITLIGSGETVNIALKAAEELEKVKVSCRVLNIHTIKPIDKNVIVKAAVETKGIITLEEHSIYGGLGAAVAEVVVENHPISMRIIGVPDEPAIAGVSSEVFKYYGMNKENIKNIAFEVLGKRRY